MDQNQVSLTKPEAGAAIRPALEELRDWALAHLVDPAEDAPP
ncbi:hypothetical protein ABZ646_43730 [Streptomyces sp. NPDC007162]